VVKYEHLWDEAEVKNNYYFPSQDTMIDNNMTLYI